MVSQNTWKYSNIKKTNDLRPRSTWEFPQLKTWDLIQQISTVLKFKKMQEKLLQQASAPGDNWWWLELSRNPFSP